MSTRPNWLVSTEAGAPAERERLLLEHLPQVRYLARRIHDRLPAKVQMEDLIHAGVVGLIDAVDKFDPSKNVQLKSYAQFRIRGAILDSLREMDWSPRSLRQQARRIEEGHRETKLRLGRPATEPELAAHLGITLLDCQHLLGELRGLDLESLQADFSEATLGGGGFRQRLPAANEDPFLTCLDTEMKALITIALGDLNDKERRVITMYYFDELTMKQVGDGLGIGESRVSQIHSLALVRLRARLKEILNSPKTSA
jgi:RNA polymerase sigma factor for flagellar operon FliA